MSGINDWDEYGRQQDMDHLRRERELNEERFREERTIEYKFIRNATLIGGPYDGLQLRGYTLPESIKVDTKAFTILMGSKEEKAQTKAAAEMTKRGTYIAGDDFVSFKNGDSAELTDLYVEVGKKMELPDETLAKLKLVPGSEDRFEPTVEVRVGYFWENDK